MFKAYSKEIFEGADVNRADETFKNSLSFKKAKNKSQTCMPNIGAMGEPEFLTASAKKAFNQLKLAFTNAPILWHFDLECHIRIKSNALGYAIGGILSLLTLDNLG